MRSTAFDGHPAEDPDAGHNGPEGSAKSFQGFRPLTANFTQVPNEIWDIDLPGLTEELRWTLATLARETIGEAYRRGGSPYDPIAISWLRWMNILRVQNRNTVRNRLARAEALGLIEIIPGERGEWGTTANRYRLRWENDGEAAPRAFHGVLRTRQREMARKQESRAVGQPTQDPPSGSAPNPPLTPGVSAATPPRIPVGSAPTPPPPNPPVEPAPNPPEGSGANPPSVKENKNKNRTENNQSVSPSVSGSNGRTDRLTELENEKINENQSVGQSVPTVSLNEINTDGPTDGIPRLNSNLSIWLKGAKPEPWPAGLLARLGVILDPPQVARIAERSPWSAAGASTILDSIQVKGRKLGNQAGTLWNALLHKEKGAGWLAKAASPKRQEDWRKASGDGAVAQVHGPPVQPETDPALYEDNEDCEEEESMAHQIDTPVLRPQELSPDRKAEIRRQVEAFRLAFRALLRPQATKEPALMKAFNQAWDDVLRSLEPLLPIQVTLPDEYRPSEIRQRSQIKTNVVNAVYDAIS